MNKKIDGYKIAEKIIRQAEKDIKKKRLKLKLGAVLVGDNPVSLSYIFQKEKICQKIGIDFSLYRYSKKIKEKDLLKKISLASRQCSGLIIQLPLPKGMNIQKILDSVPVKKDIDILTTKSIGRFYAGDFSILPPIVSAIKYIFKEEKLSSKGKNIVIIGSGKLVGKPLMLWLVVQGATISVINKKTKNISEFTKRADIIISGAGEANLINGDIIKRGVILIDAGSSVENGHLRGDIDLESVQKKARRISPVPGGVGPITTACLIENLIQISKT